MQALNTQLGLRWKILLLPARKKGHAGGSSATQSLVAPNSAFVRRRSLSRGRSASPGPRRTASPLGVSVAQRRVQLAERTAESALSGVGQVAEEIRHACSIVEAAISEARSVHGEIESKVSSLEAQAATSTAHITDALSKRVGEVMAETEAKTSHVVGTVAQQLEKEIQAVALSTAATAETMTCTAVEGMRRDVQAQIEQNRADALRDSNAVQKKVDQVSEELQKLTAQLNQFKPGSVQAVGEVQGKVSEEFQQRLVAQSERIDKLSESVIQSQKTAQDTAEMLQTILVGMENLGENFKQLQENMDYWQMPENPNVEAEHQRLNEELLKEVPLFNTSHTRTNDRKCKPNYFLSPSSDTCIFKFSRRKIYLNHKDGQ